MRPVHLSPQLRTVVHQSVRILGEVVRHELGDAAFERIEKLRKRMASLRGAEPSRAHRLLTGELERLRSLSPAEQLDMAHSYALMLELMNACENAYRSFRLRHQVEKSVAHRPASIIYVLTAHPTEARSPVNIAVFEQIQRILVDIFSGSEPGAWERLRNALGIAWRVSIARRRRPRVKDEADSIYSIVLRPEVLAEILKAQSDLCPVYLRSWVGADKDGHPSVNAETFKESLGLSRKKLLRFLEERLSEFHRDLLRIQEPMLYRRFQRFHRGLQKLKTISGGDGAAIERSRRKLAELAHAYHQTMDVHHPVLSELRSLMRIFPALVVPLELRETSDLIVDAAAGRPSTIARMLRMLRFISRGSDPRFYARGLVISMTRSFSDFRGAGELMSRELGGLMIPIIPLFEQERALKDSRKIIKTIISDHRFRRAIHEEWDGNFEIMLGYSDSAKEIGVLPSRWEIRRAASALDREARRSRVTPIFFHGSGGSTDRGGGSIEEQTGWWPASARRIYKATLQGEMVERSFASPEITRRRLHQIAEVADKKPAPIPEELGRSIDRFARRVAQVYRGTISSREFPELVEKATLYPYLHALRIGSRPTKRMKSGISGLRAIPWVLCWTQSRVLFPTWWGVGTAWREIVARGDGSAETARLLRNAFEKIPVFNSYVKVLGSTLTKVELPIWRLYLEKSGLASPEAILKDFEREWVWACRFVRSMSGQRSLIWFKPWLAESIWLRSPMIHPLNLLQLIATEKGPSALLRETVTGISSGMLTTG